MTEQRNAENDARVATVKVWSADQHDVPRGFTRGTDENFNTLRIGRLILAWGWES